MAHLKNTLNTGFIQTSVKIMSYALLRSLDRYFSYNITPRNGRR